MYNLSKKYLEASDAIKLEREIYSGLVNRAEYNEYYFEYKYGLFYSGGEPIPSKVDRKLEKAIDELEESNYTQRAIAYSKMENYFSPKKILQLFDKFKTFNELRASICEIN